MADTTSDTIGKESITNDSSSLPDHLTSRGRRGERKRLKRDTYGQYRALETKIRV